MKLIVETTGPFQIYVPGLDNHAHFDRASVVNNLSLMQIKVASGELKVHGQVNDDATDAEFVQTLEASKGDVELAIASFMSEFPMEGAEPVEPKLTKAEQKAADKAEAEQKAADKAEAERLAAEAEAAEAEAKAKAEAEAEAAK